MLFRSFTTYHDAYVASLANPRAFIDAGYTPSALNVQDEAASIANFTSGDYAFLYSPSWNNVAIWDQTQATGFDVGVYWWPSANPNYETGAYIAGWGSPLSGWCAKADTQYPELAVEVIKVINRAEAARHLNAGLGTNHIQDGTPTPANDIEAQRFELRANVGEFLKGFWQNSVDGSCSRIFSDTLTSVLSEDPQDFEASIAELDAAWQANTFFD